VPYTEVHLSQARRRAVLVLRLGCDRHRNRLRPEGQQVRRPHTTPLSCIPLCSFCCHSSLRFVSAG